MNHRGWETAREVRGTKREREGWSQREGGREKWRESGKGGRTERLRERVRARHRRREGGGIGRGMEEEGGKGRFVRLRLARE